MDYFLRKFSLLGDFAARYRFVFVSLCVFFSGAVFSVLLLLNASYLRMQFVMTSVAEVFLYLFFVTIFRLILKKTFTKIISLRYWCKFACEVVIWVISLLCGILVSMLALEILTWRSFFRFDYLKLLLTTIGILMAASIPILLTSYFNIQKKEHLEHTTRLATQAKLQLLQSKVNPHFLFNSLNSIIYLANQSDLDSIKNMVYSLSQLYRTVLSTSAATLIPLGNELDMIAHYLAIEKIRFGSRLTYTITCPDDMRSVMIPFFIIEVFVENAVLHGVFPKPEGGEVTITVSRSCDRARIVISDTGRGYDPDCFTPKGNGFGISSVINRLNLVYASDYSYTVQSQCSLGTIVTLEVPYGKF